MEENLRYRLAILGATGHIAKALIHEFRSDPEFELFLVSRSPERVRSFLRDMDFSAPTVLGYGDFGRQPYGGVVNCVGIGDPERLRQNPGEVFSVTEAYDNLVLDYLRGRPGTRYIHLSSGAVYGKDFAEPAEDESALKLEVNHLGPEDFYAIAKLNAEAKHRAMPGGKIVDLRIFGFFSRFIDLGTRYLLTEIINCLRDGTPLETGPSDILRDYVHPRDLFALVRLALTGADFNGAVDAYSAGPARKFEILDYFARNWGLRVARREDFRFATATGSKENYYSRNRRAEDLGYSPRFTALQAVVEESQEILEGASGKAPGHPPETF